MLSHKNLLSLAMGDLVIVPSQDMVPNPEG